MSNIEPGRQRYPTMEQYKNIYFMSNPVWQQPLRCGLRGFGTPKSLDHGGDLRFS
jgi:hypothetical protein